MKEEYQTTRLADFLKALGLDEEPMGVLYTDQVPEQGISPKPQPPVSREAETQGTVDWELVQKNFTCVLGVVWRARKKRVAAYFDKERFGCLGGAFYMGFMKPYLNMHPYFISTGIPDILPGERYAESPEAAQAFFEAMDPEPAAAKYLVIKPISQFSAEEEPVVVTFFARPEVISGLYTLSAFITSDIDAVRTPFGAGCSSITSWPIKYLKEGKINAVLGGLDPSCRKFLKTDEVTFAVPFEMYCQMLDRWEESFLKESTWSVVKKKAKRSKKTWGEDEHSV